MKKRIIGILLCCIMVMSLVACGKEKSGGSKGKNNPKEIMSAFSEYYVAYSDEHYRKDIEQYDIDYLTSEHWDCIGKMIYFDNQPMMMIADLVGTSPTSKDFIYNIHIFAYEKSEVVEKYTVKDLITWDDGFSYFVDDNAVLIKTFADAYEGEYEGTTYELKDGEVKAYIICKGDEKAEGEEIYYADYLDGDDTPVEVDDAVKNSYYLEPLPFNYFLSDCEEELIENKYFGALTQEDFVSFLDKLGELEYIDSEAQLEKMYCDFMGYKYTGIMNNIIPADTDVDGFYLNDELYKFSNEEGLENLKNMPTSAQYFITKGEKSDIEITDINYYKTNGLNISEDVVDASEAGCIIGYGRDKVDLGLCQGVPTIISGSHNSIRYDSGIGYHSRQNGNDIRYGCLRLNFIDGYEIAGLTKDSTEEDIIYAGYQPTCYQHVYYNIYSEVPVDYEKIQTDCNLLYNSGLSKEDIEAGRMGEYIDYDDEFFGSGSIVRGYTGGDSFYVKYGGGINSDADKYYEGIANAEFNSYTDEIKMRLAIASQMYLLNTGKIDYFVVAQIDATDGANDRQFVYVPWHMDSKYGYDDNTLSLYIISSMEDYENWLKQAGWTE